MPNVQGDAKARKDQPIYSGVIRYFPRALAAIAHLSKVGNDQHNPGKPLHWDRSKSGDELDALARHLVDAGTFDTDGERHSTKVAWRGLANLEKELEAAEKAGETPPLGHYPDHEAQAVVEGRPFSYLGRSATETAAGGHSASGGEIGHEGFGAPLAGSLGAVAGISEVADVADGGGGVGPFVPLTFSRPPRTEDWGPEYESDGEAVSDAVAYQDMPVVTDHEPTSPKREGTEPTAIMSPPYGRYR